MNEPTSLVAICFLLGAVVAVMLTILLVAMVEIESATVPMTETERPAVEIIPPDNKTP